MFDFEPGEITIATVGAVNGVVCGPVGYCKRGESWHVVHLPTCLPFVQGLAAQIDAKRLCVCLLENHAEMIGQPTKKKLLAACSPAVIEWAKRMAEEKKFLPTPPGTKKPATFRKISR